MQRTQVQPRRFTRDLSLDLHVCNAFDGDLYRHATRWLARTNHPNAGFCAGGIGRDFFQQQANGHSASTAAAGK
jgi:hypothetical protein